MGNNERSYRSNEEYREDIISLGKSWLSSYIKALEQEGEEISVKQHLFQDTLLRKEVMNFLKDNVTANTGSSCPEFEAAVIRKADASMKSDMFLPLEYLCQIFGLTAFERLCITLLYASELDSGFEKVYAYINNDWQRNTLSIEMVIDIYTGTNQVKSEYYSCFSKESTLYQYLLENRETQEDYWFKHALTLKPRVTAFLLGHVLENDEIKEYIQVYSPDSELEPILLGDKPYLHIQHYLTSDKDTKCKLFYLYGCHGMGKKLNVKYFAKEHNQSLFFLSLDKIEHSGMNAAVLSRLILFEVIMRQGLLCICSNNRQLSEDEHARTILNEILSMVKEMLLVVFLTSDCIKKATFTEEALEVIAIEMSRHNLLDNCRFWEELAKGYRIAPEIDLRVFANKFMLSPGQIKEIFTEAKRLALWHEQDRITLPILQKVCFEHIEHNLGKRAQKVKMMFGWEELILPEYQKNMLKTACNQIKYKYKVFSQWGYEEKLAYGTGLSIIFSGSPGTGKTMAAQVLANELGLELYKIELAAVVSKYIGETERNLNEIFEEAEKSQGIIFFDEADVLFSKRSEVKDSNDKYSNMEAAFMLQKIEEYSGIVILATNYQQNIDEAFKRRIKYLIDFPFPDSTYRKKLWLNAFPAKLPLSSDVDIDFLADKFELTGSNIKNVALNAAFLAASEDTCVGMQHIVKSVVNEFTKSGKKIAREELGEYYMFV